MKLAVIVHPNSKNPRVDKDLLGTIHIYVSEPPLEGKANNAVIGVLSNYLKVKKYQVQLVSGQKSKHKVFEIKN